MPVNILLIDHDGRDKEVRAYANLADAQDKMLELAIAEANIIYGGEDVHDFETLDEFIEEIGGNLDACFCDFGYTSGLVLTIYRDVDIETAYVPESA